MNEGSHPENIAPRSNLLSRRDIFSPKQLAKSLSKNSLETGLDVGLTLIAGSIGLATEYKIGEANIESQQNISFYEEGDVFRITGSTHAQFIGISHTPATIEKYRNQLENSIQHSSVVFLEYFNQEIRDKANPNIPITSMQETERDITLTAYGEIGQICAKYSKDVVVVNPEDDLGLTQLYEALILYGLPPVAITHLIAGACKKDIRKRDFLALGASLLEWSVFTNWTMQLQAILFKKPQMANIMSGYEDTLGRNYIDFRNVMSALGIREAFATWEDLGNNAIVLQGAAHNGAEGYLKKPELANIKSKIYEDYQLVGHADIQRYHWNGQKWALSSKTLRSI